MAILTNADLKIKQRDLTYQLWLKSFYHCCLFYLSFVLTVFCNNALQHKVFWYRSSHQRCSVRKGVLRNFAKFTGKHLWLSLLFNKFAGLRPATLLKKRLLHGCFSVNFSKFVRTPFLQNTSELLFLLICWIGHVSNYYNKCSIQIIKFKATYLLKITAKNYYKLRQLYCAAIIFIIAVYKLIQIITIITNITIITKYSKILLQITTKNYYKLRQLISLQNSKLLQITSSFSTNYGNFYCYYKLRQILLQITAGVTNYDVITN